MVKPNPVQQLRAVNELLAQTIQADPEQVEHARRALDFYEIDHAAKDEEPSIEQCVEALARVHFNGAEANEIAFAHWHAPASEEMSPLWIREAIVSQMMKLSGSRGAVLVVTSLREAICPEGGYWTKARELRFRRIRQWVEEIACAWASPGANLQVVVL